MTARTVTGNIQQITGAASPNAFFTVTLADPFRTTAVDSVMIGESLLVTADSSGDFTFDVEEGVYQIVARTVGGAKTLTMTVDTAGPWTIGRLVGSTASMDVAAAAAAAAAGAAASFDSAMDLKAPLASPTFTGTVAGVTKAHVGLGAVDNTSDAGKPVSTATQTALDAKAPLAGPTFTGTVAGVTKAHVGLGNADNTSDAGKPISTATQTALNAKLATASKASPVETIGGTSSTKWTTPEGVRAALSRSESGLRQELINQGDRQRSAPSLSPGYTINLYSTEFEGDGTLLPSLRESNLRASEKGPVYRIHGEGDCATRHSYPLESNRLYRARTQFRRATNTDDPAGDAVEFVIVWLNADNTTQGLTGPLQVVQRWEELDTGDGWIERAVVFATSDLTGVDEFNPAAQHARAMVRQYGSGENPKLDVRILVIEDITDAEIASGTAANAETRLTALESRTPWSTVAQASSTNLDTFYTQGLHTISSPAGTGLPSTMASTVEVENIYSSSALMHQIVRNLAGSEFRQFMRARISSTWTPWRVMATEAYVDAREAAITAAMPVRIAATNATPAFVTNSGTFTATYASRWQSWERVGNICHVQGAMVWDFTAINSALRLIIPLPYAPSTAIAGVNDPQQAALVQASGNVPTPTGWLGMNGFIVDDGSMPAGLHLAYNGVNVVSGAERGIYSITSHMATGTTYSINYSASYQIEVGP